MGQEGSLGCFEVSYAGMGSASSIWGSVAETRFERGGPLGQPKRKQDLDMPIKSSCQGVPPPQSCPCPGPALLETSEP